jgi:hypothetical protein
LDLLDNDNYGAIKRKLFWYRLVVSTGTKGFFVKKKVLWAGVEPRLSRSEHVELPLHYLEISNWSGPSVQIKGKEALGTGLFPSPGAKGYFISHPLGT